MEVYAFNPVTWEAEASIFLRSQGYSPCSSKRVLANQGFRMIPCLKKKKTTFLDDGDTV